MESVSSFLIIVYFSLLFSVFGTCAATDNIALSQPFGNGMTLNSSNGVFQLGFFTPNNSNNHFLGIWYKNIPIKTIVWVANREAPIRHPSPLLKINSTGHILLLLRNTTVWSATPSREVHDPVLQLLNTGNLVLREATDEIPENYLWQSFDYPSDTLLPGMKLGKDFRTGLDRRVTASKSDDDPSPSNFSWGMHTTNYPEPVVWLNSQVYYRSGPWNGLAYSGRPTINQATIFLFEYISNENETYYKYHLVNESILARQVLNETTLSRQPYVWVEADKNWRLYVKIPRDSCDIFGQCGPNGRCNYGNWPAACECLHGFKPKSPDKWNAGSYSDGCVRDLALSCHNDDFLKFEKLKMPDTTNTWLDQNMTLSQCRENCQSNCSCMAYTNSDINGAGSGCALWFGDLNDMRVQPDGGQELYIRLRLGGGNSSKVKIAIIIVGIIAIISLFLSVVYFIRRKRSKGNSVKPKIGKAEDSSNDDLDLPLFELSTIVAATGNFSLNNKLGEGGFGAVYWGTLEDGKEIAVKRLSTSSGQGINEFKNEVRLIAKLQHRNLVKLLGCCTEDKERLLIYEYMPNGSLDSYIFDETRGKLLDWSKRFHIICGIARGLLYLHQDSRLRIVHRDLKASNVLLDNDMNPKISDFGMARTFGGDQTAANTDRVVGTYGYMAPEYAIDGNFSVKSDVFSFGVLVLEMVTGKKSRGFYSPSNNVNLIGLVWNYWKDQKPLQVIDGSIEETCNVSEALRCIHISLLCLAHDPEDRPSMSSVVMMLNSRTALSEPQEPGFLLGKRSTDGNSSTKNIDSCSVNGLSITILEAR